MEDSYLYDRGPMSYPIQEYKPDPSTSTRSNSGNIKASFVVDINYPRLVQFYHPTSPICQSFQPTFIDTGRIFRSDNNAEYHKHQNRVGRATDAATVTFHAVNCAAHMDVCASPEFAIHAVPVLLAFSKGSQKGKVVKRTDDNLLVLDYVANVLGVKLHDSHGGSTLAGGNRQYHPPLPNQLGEQSKVQNENEAAMQGLHGTSSGGENNGNTDGRYGDIYSGMGDMSEEEVATEMMRRDVVNKVNTVVFAAHAGNHDQIVMKQNRNSLTQIRMFEDAATSFLVRGQCILPLG